MPEDKSWWAIFRSMKMGLFLFLAISLASMVGTIVPQQPPQASVSWLEHLLQPGNVYHSWWYITLLSLLTLNLTACSLYRLKTLQTDVNRSERLLDREQLMKLKAHTSFSLTGEIAEIKERIIAILARRGYKVWSEPAADKIRIGAQQGRFNVWGSFITHVSFVVILLGVLTGGVFGFQGTIDAPAGTSFSLSDITGIKSGVLKNDFKVRVDKFWTEKYANGTPSGYFSRLTILENDKAVQTSTVGVNAPVNYKGVKFYQSGYGNAVEIRVSRSDGTSHRGLVLEGDSFQAAGTNLSILVYRYIPDYNPASGMQSKSDQPNNPRVIYAIFQGEQRTGMGVAEFGSRINLDHQGNTFNFIKTIPYTGLQVKKDPGIPLVWLGSGFILLGMALSFFLQPRYLWLAAERKEGLIAVSLGGTAPKNPLALADHIQNIANDIQQGIANDIQQGIKPVSREPKKSKERQEHGQL